MTNSLNNLKRWIETSTHKESADLAAVQQDGHAVEHLTPEQRTPEVCLAAVQQYGYAVQYLTPDVLDKPNAEQFAQWLADNWESTAQQLGDKAPQWADRIIAVLETSKPETERQRG